EKTRASPRAISASRTRARARSDIALRCAIQLRTAGIDPVRDGRDLIGGELRPAPRHLTDRTVGAEDRTGSAWGPDNVRLIRFPLHKYWNRISRIRVVHMGNIAIDELIECQGIPEGLVRRILQQQHFMVVRHHLRQELLNVRERIQWSDRHLYILMVSNCCR